jgi:hypothetical protein
MSYILRLFVVLFLFSFKFSAAQVLGNESQYLRPSVTFLFLEERESKKRDVASAIIENYLSIQNKLVYERFDYLPIGQKSISPLNIDPEPQPPIRSGRKDMALFEFIQYLKYKKNLKKYKAAKTVALTNEIPQIAKEVVKKLYNVDRNGNMNYDYLVQRGLYTASDADIILNKAAANDRLFKLGEELLNKVMIIVYEIETVTKYDKAYFDAKDKANKAFYDSLVKKGYKLDPPKPVERPYEGYGIDFNVHIYKIDPAWFATFLSEFYVDASLGSDQRRTKINALQRAVIPITEVSKLPRSIMATASYGSNASMEELFKTSSQDMQYTAFETSNKRKENLSDLTAKSTVFQSYPISSKIGTKEDVFRGQRFTVYQSLQKNETSAIQKKFVGVVEAQFPISDNRSNSTGNTTPTNFKQTYGKRVYPGMQLVPRKGTRSMIGGAGYLRNSIGSGFSLNIELRNIATSFKEDKEYFKKSKKSKGLYYGLEGLIVPNYSIGTLTVAKEFYLLKTGNIFLYPKFGIGYSEASSMGNMTSSGASLSPIALVPSLGLGFNISPSLVLMARVIKIPPSTMYKQDPRDINNILEEKGPSTVTGVSLKLRF